MPSVAFVTRTFVFRLGQFGSGNPCSKGHRLLNATAGKTFCSAPIRATRQSTDTIRVGNSKFPFVDRFQVSTGESYSSAEVIAKLSALATGKRLESFNKVR